MELLKQKALLFIVFITGACVLVLEVVAVRILSPFFGNVKEINKDKDTSPQAKNNPLHLCTDNSWVAQFRGDKVKVKMQDILTMMPLDY